MAMSHDASKIYTAAIDGTVVVWDIDTGSNDRIEGKGHGNQVTGIVVKNDLVYTSGIDDTVKVIDMSQKRYNNISISVGSQPRHISSLEDGVIAVTVNDVCVIRNNKKVGSFPVSYEGLCISKNQTNDSTLVAIGGDDSKTHIYELKGNVLNEVSTLDHRGVVTDVCFSPDGKFLATSDADRKVIVYSIPGFEKFNKLEWGFHNARINCLAWSPDSTLVASGSLDTMIIVWSMNQPSKHIIIRNSHPQSQVNALVWFNNEKLYSAGHDSLIKSWSVKF